MQACVAVVKINEKKEKNIHSFVTPPHCAIIICLRNIDSLVKTEN
jgi:hypothetical protein